MVDCFQRLPQQSCPSWMPFAMWFFHLFLTRGGAYFSPLESCLVSWLALTMQYDVNDAVPVQGLGLKWYCSLHSCSFGNYMEENWGMQPKASTEVPGGTGQEQTSKATLGGFGNESSRELTLLSSSCWTHPKQWFRASSEPSCQGSKPTSATYCVTLGKLFPLFHFPLLQDGDNKSLFS